MNRPSYKELWLYERKDRDEQLQWIRDAVDGNAEFCNSEPPYSEEEELARKIMQMHARITELEEELARLQEKLRDEMSQLKIATDLGNKRWVALNDIYENGEKHNANWCKRIAQKGLGIK